VDVPGDATTAKGAGGSVSWLLLGGAGAWRWTLRLIAETWACQAEVRGCASRLPAA